MRYFSAILLTSGLTMLFLVILPATIWIMGEVYFVSEPVYLLVTLIFLGSGVLLVAASFLFKRKTKKTVTRQNGEKPGKVLCSSGIYLGFFIALVVGEVFFESDVKMPPIGFFAFFAIVGFFLHLGREAKEFK